MTAYSEGNRNISKQINIDKHHPLLESLSEALNDYVKFPEPHLDFLQLHILAELLDFLFWGNIISKMANAHLAYPDLALDIFSGTYPDQNAEAFIRLIDCKINFALGTEPEAGELEHVIYLFRKKASFTSLLRGPAAEWYGSTIQGAMTWDEVRTLFTTRFFDGRNKFRHRMEVEHCIRADGEKIRKLPSPNKEDSRQRLARRYGWNRPRRSEFWAHRTSSPEETKIHWIYIKRTQTPIFTTESPRIFDGTSECNLERFFDPLN